jgi:hypothetical protein
MIRLACVLALIALVALVQMVVHLDGGSAIVFFFIGLPTLALALALYALARWRAGAFRSATTPTQ